MSIHDSVQIFEVGPRDGLQNEKTILSTADKLWLIRSLSQAGLKNIEAGSFVRPDKVPQMADSELVCESLLAGAQANHDSNFWFLVPNLKGLERAIAKKTTHIALFTAVSEQFNQKNIGMSVDQSFDEIKKIITEARKSGLKIRGYVSTVWGCPFEGRIDAKKAISVIERMLALDVDQVSIGDTIGVAAPFGVKEVLKPLLSHQKKIAVHFHDTRGTSLANSLTAYELGIRAFDASAGGLGGCPFAPGASGNLATEDLIYLFKEMKIETGIDYAKLCETSLELAKRMGNRALSSKALQAYAVNGQKNSVWDI